MKTTYKRVHVHLNKQEAELLERMCEEMQETQSGVLKRCLAFARIQFELDTIRRKAKNKEAD